jgi:hypothetical protein
MNNTLAYRISDEAAQEIINTLTDEQKDAILAQVERWVENIGWQRRQTQGKQFNDVDFATGGMAAYAVLGKAGSIPGVWVFTPMAGANLFTEKPDFISNT